jgi:phosphoribosylanthranilate isomerase
MSVWIKVCGVTTLEDARAVVEAGVDAIGLNFVPSSKRYIEPAVARSLVQEVGRKAVSWVGVVADVPTERLAALRAEVGLDWIQLHGAESPEDLERLLPGAFKALPIADAKDVARAASFGGDRILVDAHVPGTLGGTGQTFDWNLVSDLVRRRRVVLAGGLRPENVAEAIVRCAPWGVDVASGVESAPGRKDPAAVREFVRRARAAEEGVRGKG